MQGHDRANYKKLLKIHKDWQGKAKVLQTNEKYKIEEGGEKKIDGNEDAENTDFHVPSASVSNEEHAPPENCK